MSWLLSQVLLHLDGPGQQLLPEVLWLDSPAVAVRENNSFHCHLCGITGTSAITAFLHQTETLVIEDHFAILDMAAEWTERKSQGRDLIYEPCTL